MQSHVKLLVNRKSREEPKMERFSSYSNGCWCLRISHLCHGTMLALSSFSSDCVNRREVEERLLTLINPFRYFVVASGCSGQCYWNWMIAAADQGGRHGSRLTTPLQRMRLQALGLLPVHLPAGLLFARRGRTIHVWHVFIVLVKPFVFSPAVSVLVWLLDRSACCPPLT